MRGTRAWSPTGLIPWFSKTKGNTYATLLHHPFLFKGKPTQPSQVKISGTVAGEFVKKSTIPSTHHNPYLSHYIICLSFSSPPLHPCRFICPLFPVRLFFACLLCACVLDCLSLWLKIIINCVTFPIPIIMISLALRLLLLMMLSLVKSMLLSESCYERSILRPS